MTDHEIDVVDAMARHGLPFSRSLAESFRKADEYNFTLLKDAFKYLWDYYDKIDSLEKELQRLISQNPEH